MRRVFSGIQPTGALHLGNYLGAVQHWVRLQPPAPAAATEAPLFCLVDLHAMTLPYDAGRLSSNCRSLMATLLACGLDPARSTLFRQSAVREHTELAWLLSCATPLGWLERMTQFKEKGRQSAVRGAAGLGLLSYPVLQAADILLYKATSECRRRRV